MGNRTINKTTESDEIFKPTEIGEINRKIEKSVHRIVIGERGALDETIRLAKERERILIGRTERK